MTATAALSFVFTACTTTSGRAATSIDHRTLRDGTRVALVAPVASAVEPDRIEAFVRIDDLERSGRALICDVGLDWHRQRTSTAEVLSTVSPGP